MNGIAAGRDKSGAMKFYGHSCR